MRLLHAGHPDVVHRSDCHAIRIPTETEIREVLYRATFAAAPATRDIVAAVEEAVAGE